MAEVRTSVDRARDAFDALSKEERDARLMAALQGVMLPPLGLHWGKDNAHAFTHDCVREMNIGLQQDRFDDEGGAQYPPRPHVPVVRPAQAEQAPRKRRPL